MDIDIAQGGSHTKVRFNGRRSTIPGHSQAARIDRERSGVVIMRYAYPFTMEPQPEGGFTVTFPDVPEAITEGDTEPETLARAEDALVTALSFYVDETKPLPLPSAARGRPVAIVPPLVAAKLALHDAMLTVGISNVELARQLRLDEKAIRRLRDPLHRSHIGQVESALRILGKRLEIRVAQAI